MPANVYKILSEAIEKRLRERDCIEQFKQAKLPLAILTPEEMQKRINGLSKIVPYYIKAVRHALPK